MTTNYVRIPVRTFSRGLRVKTLVKQLNQYDGRLGAMVRSIATHIFDVCVLVSLQTLMQEVSANYMRWPCSNN